MIRWPREGRMHGVFTTKFRQVDSELSGYMVEEVEDVKVRARLEAAGVDGIRWASILDVHGITPVGTQSCHTLHDQRRFAGLAKA